MSENPKQPKASPVRIVVREEVKTWCAILAVALIYLVGKSWA